MRPEVLPSCHLNQCTPNPDILECMFLCGYTLIYVWLLYVCVFVSMESLSIFMCKFKKTKKTRMTASIHTHTQMYAHAHTHLHARTHACVHAHACTRTHTHTHKLLDIGLNISTSVNAELCFFSSVALFTWSMRQQVTQAVKFWHVHDTCYLCWESQCWCHSRTTQGHLPWYATMGQGQWILNQLIGALLIGTLCMALLCLISVLS